MKKKVAIIIEARSSSKRLPGKILLPLGNKTVLEYLIKRLKTVSKKINSKIIIATTINEDDKKIVNLAKKNFVNFYQGSENNVLKRVVEAAQKYKINTGAIPKLTKSVKESNSLPNSEVPLINLAILPSSASRIAANKIKVTAKL